MKDKTVFSIQYKVNNISLKMLRISKIIQELHISFKNIYFLSFLIIFL